MNPSKLFFEYVLKNNVLNSNISLIEFVKVCQFFTGTCAGNYGDGIDIETSKELYTAFQKKDWKAVERILEQ
jgi:hypothetical protein